MKLLKALGYRIPFRLRLARLFGRNVSLQGEHLPALLKEGAKGFLRGGGYVTLEEWGGLLEEEQAALIAAGEELRLADAVQIGTAGQSKADAAALFAGLDGGETYKGLLLRHHADRAVNKILDLRGRQS